MASHSNKLVDNMVDSQKKVMDSVVENTKKFAGGNHVLNETIEKGSEWYKNWLETQKSFFNKATNAAENGQAQAESMAKDATTAANDFLQNWLNQQAAWAKQVWEMSQESAKKFGWNAANPFAGFQGWSAGQNPYTAWTENMNQATSAWTNWMNQFNGNNWLAQAQQFNPFSNEGMKKATEGYTDFMNKYYNSLNSSFTEWTKNFENATAQDAYKNMINTAEAFTKFAEIWMPMLKSMNEKTFNMEEYKKLMDPKTYTEFVDKFFGFMPEGSREYFNKFGTMATDSYKQMTDAGMNAYNQYREYMNKFGNGSQAFGNAMTAWNNWQNQMSEAAAPFTKLIAPNQYTRTAQEWSEISNRVLEYNVKNAELQYMIYTTGTKVMDKLAEHMAKQVKEGKQITSIVGLYEEWLNISDKVYVSLFESSEYSKLMSEVASLQMSLKKDMELQMEKMLKDVPVATRSEMDEVYKTIYDLKKQVRQLEKMLEIETEVEEAPKATKTNNGRKK